MIILCYSKALDLIHGSYTANESRFSIINTSKEDCKFEVGLELDSQVEEYIRMEVLSRFSNTPLIGTVTLSPLGSVEVRVRTYARADVRIPINSQSYLFNRDGISFGTLTVTPKKTGGEEEGITLRHTISMRGIFNEIPIFMCAEKRLVFHSFV